MLCVCAAIAMRPCPLVPLCFVRERDRDKATEHNDRAHPCVMSLQWSVLAYDVMMGAGRWGSHCGLVRVRLLGAPTARVSGVCFCACCCELQHPPCVGREETVRAV